MLIDMCFIYREVRVGQFRMTEFSSKTFRMT